MILTDKEIEIAIEHSFIVVDPVPSKASYSSTSLDLLLDDQISEFKDLVGGITQTIDPSQPGFNHKEVFSAITNGVKIDPTNGYDFYPGKLILAWTKEYVELKAHSRIAARVEGKSSLARLGIGVHITAPTIHSGFSGQIRLEMVNHGKIPVKLRTGMKICQLIFEQTIGTPVRGCQGRFSNQATKFEG